MTTLPEDEFTELVDADFPRVDLVGKGANGIPRFLIAKQDAASTGLLEPQFVRDLIGKEAGPVPEDTKEQVTMSGSPAAIAKLIHGAPVRKAGMLSMNEALGGYGLDPAVKAAQSTKAQNDLPDSAFAYIEPGGKKDADGKTVPRSKRHFPINDAAHVRNALARLSSSPFGDKASPKVHAAAKKFGISVSKEAAVDGDTVSKDALTPDPDDGVDGLDPTVPLAAPDDLDDCPGDPTDPGSPAWEAIDAATAQKWCSILARAQNAICLLSDREMLEVATGADPGDADSACDLADAASCLDYVIGQLAVFAAGEQAETDLAAEAVGKAAAAAEAPVQVIESLSAIRKAGRVLSAANEGKIRQAAQSLSEVLASLPQAPDGGQGAAPVIKEGAMPEDQNGTGDQAVAKDSAPASPDAQARDTGPVNAGGTTGLGQPRVTGPDSALPADGPQQALPGDPPGRQVIKEARPRKGRHKVARGLPVALYGPGRVLLGVAPAKAVVRKADAPAADGTAATMQAVFDQDGNLVGVVDPSDITPVAGTDSKPEPDAQPDAAPAADPGDMTPQPAADAGTPADGVTKTADAAPEDVAKSGGTTTDEITITRDMLKSIAADAAREALTAQEAAHQEVVAKMAADNAGLAQELDVVKGRLETVEKQPAMPGVFANGATPPAGAVPPPRAALRGQDTGAAAVDVAKAAELKQTLYRGTAHEQNQAFHEMQQMAIDQLAAIQRR